MSLFSSFIRKLRQGRCLVFFFLAKFVVRLNWQDDR